MTGYVRRDTDNNIADGNVINASDLDNEFDGIQDAFDETSGHTHDGTVGGGAGITKVGPAQDLTVSSIAVLPKITNTVDLGSSSFEFKDLYVDGVANLDSVVVDSLTHVNGTANGVTYLNGSKVLTSGSALTFDGSTFKVATATSGDLLVVESTDDGASAAPDFVLYRNSASPAASDQVGNILWRGKDSGGADQAYARILTVIASPTAGAETASFQIGTQAGDGLQNRYVIDENRNHIWSGSAEAMRLTSTGLTIEQGLTTKGNTTLGDASTDTVTVNGYMGVGATPSSSYQGYINGSGLVGADQRALRTNLTATSAATNAAIGVSSGVSTEAASFTTGSVQAFRVFNGAKGAGSTITNQYGLYVEDLTNGTNNYGITSLVSSGTNKWNIYASGTAANYFAGSVGIGTSSPTTQLVLSGAGATLSGSTTYNLQTVNSTTGFGVRLGQDGANGTISGIGASGLTFWTYNGSAWGERVRISSAGNVGIGTSSPSSALTVQANLGALVADTSGARYIEIVPPQTSNSFVGGIGTRSSHALALTTVGTERLRIDTSGNVGIGTSSISAVGTKTTLHVAGANGSAIRLSDDTSNAFLDYTDASGMRISVNANEPLTLRTNSQDRLIIDGAGNVGIGTISPSSKLHLSGAATADARITLTQTTAGLTSTLQQGSSGLALSALGAQSLLLETNGVDRVTIDSAGNLGLGVTPSGWGASQRAIDIGYSGALKSSTGASSVVSLTNNAYYTTAWTYKQTGQAAALYDLRDTGEHRWYTAPSGTAGGTITFTQAMTLTAAGNLGVGKSSPSRKLHVYDTGSIPVRFETNTSDTKIEILTTSGTQFIQGSANNLLFGTNSAERARIDSSGNLLVGGADSYGKIYARSDSTSFPNLKLQNEASSGYFANFSTNGNSTVGTISFTIGGTAYNTSSDYRLKNNIAPMTGALAKVRALKPVTYKWNADGSDGEGFIAHELAEVVPQCVTGEKDAVDADGKPVYQGIDTSFLVATLTAAIQEQQAIIESLTARVSALEGN